jgi:hypothetical protein
MSKADTITFTEEIENCVYTPLVLDETFELAYTDPEAVEIELETDIRVIDSAGRRWKINPEDRHVVVHLIREDGA